MAKKLIIGLMAVAFMLLSAGYLFAADRTMEKEICVGPERGDMAGWDTYIGYWRCPPPPNPCYVWCFSDLLWNTDFFGTHFNTVAPCTLKDVYVRGNYGTYSQNNPVMRLYIWDDDGMGEPGVVLDSSAVTWDTTGPFMPGNPNPYRMSWQPNLVLTTTDFHIGGKMEGPLPDSVYDYDMLGNCFEFTLPPPGYVGVPVTDDIRSWVVWASTADPTVYWLGPDFADSANYVIEGMIHYGPDCIDQMVILPCDDPMMMGPPGSQVHIPVYGNVCGHPDCMGNPENLDGLVFAVDFDTTFFHLDTILYEVTDPVYTSFYDLIPAIDKWSALCDNVNGRGEVGIVFKYAGSPDIPPGEYKMVDLVFTVDPATSVDECYPLTFPAVYGTPPKSPSFTYYVCDVNAVTVDGEIFVPSHVMNGVTFDPDPAETDEKDCIIVEVLGGCTGLTDAHTLTVTDWGGADAFGTFVQDGFTGENTHGVLTFCPGPCDGGVYHIWVRDDCEEYGVFEEAMLCLTVNDKFDKFGLFVSDGSIMPGSDIEVCIEIECITAPPDDIGGYNFLLHFDNSMLTLTGVRDMYGMEYFYWDEFQVDDGNKVRIMGIANKPNQIDTDPIPANYEGPIVCLDFHVSAKWDCNYYLWLDWEVDNACVDNTITDGLGQVLYTTAQIERPGHPIYWEEGRDWDLCRTSYCDEWYDIPGELVLNGAKIECFHIYGPNGDVNMDYIRYTIADAVYFMEYLKGAVQLIDPDYQGAASDINFDGHQWTIADLIMLVNILNGSATPVGEGKVLASTANITVGNTISTDAEIGGIYLTVKGGGEPVLNAAGMDMETSLVNGERRIIVMSWDSNTATGDLVTIPGSFEITSVEVSDPAGYLMKVTTVPSEFALAQNYPNPFNPNTNIAFSLPTDANVSLTVYNIAGQKVAELVNGEVKAGHHTVTWNAADVTSGVYFYTIKAGNYTATRKMVFMK